MSFFVSAMSAKQMIQNDTSFISRYPALFVVAPPVLFPNKNADANARWFYRFIKSFGKIMYWRHFIATPLFNLSIAVSIYCQKMMGYPAGYGLAVVSYVQMAVMCYAGQNITDRNDRLLQGLYESKWYLLPNRDQKDVMHMIHRLQNEVTLTIGPFQELNLETLKVLSQKMYSYLMFLNNFEA